MVKKLIGEILKNNAALKDEELEKALLFQKERGGRLGEILLQLKVVDEEDVLRALSYQLDLTYLPKIKEEKVDVGTISLVPINFVKKHKIFPIRDDNGQLKIAMHDPLDIQALDDIRLFLGEAVETVVSPESEIVRAINRYYDLEAGAAERMIQNMDGENLEGLLAQDVEETSDLMDMASEAPIIKLVNLIIFEAIKDRASDIHVEPFERELKVRYRIDGLLYNVLSPQKRLQAAITSRLKIMANLNIAERRLPQDGRIKIKASEKDIDIRVSTVPTAFGERIVLRLLDRSSILLGLEEIGLGHKNYEIFEKLIKRSNGIILVTGPTGSGKTTTLYGTLNKINSPDKNIITIEDPIEYQLAGIGQIHVNPKIDLTFAKGLRSILRQDPDVIMIGEIRDVETAEIAVQASLTGHLVFSTLHTNDAAGALTRLLDMGVESFLVSSSLITVMAQRLVRVLCPNCREPFKPGEKILEELNLNERDLDSWSGYFYRGKGCDHCLNTGFRGRTGIYELLLIDDDIRALILKNTDSSTIKREAVRKGMKTLMRDGAEKILRGITTVEEVMRVTQD